MFRGDFCCCRWHLTWLQLTLIRSLEILDISRNKIKRLPTQPGSLSKLRVRFSIWFVDKIQTTFCFQVLCIARNRVTRLPEYLTDFSNLDVLKVDHNPIEWPPKPIIETDGSPSDSQAMKDWILGLQRWLRENSQARLDIKPKHSAESFTSERALNHSM